MVPAPGPRVAILVDDPWRARQLEAILDRADPDKADVLVLDLPEGAALPPLPAARPLLVLTDDEAIAADRTVAGVLPREAPASRVLAAVHAVAEGLSVRVPQAPAPRLLTAREAEILALIAQGLSNKSIARRLGISAHTVKYHLEAVFSKLGVNSRAEALSRGIQRGLVAV
jgi:DNA-binding NarL/FixJ family response regulator